MNRPKGTAPRGSRAGGTGASQPLDGHARPVSRPRGTYFPRTRPPPLDSRKEPVIFSFRMSKEAQMPSDRSDVLQGTLDMLVLKALHLEDMHGWGITERLEQWSDHILQLGQGTLYPALYRLERQRFIKSS